MTVKKEQAALGYEDVVAVLSSVRENILEVLDASPARVKAGLSVVERSIRGLEDDVRTTASLERP